LQDDNDPILKGDWCLLEKVS